MKKFSRFVSVLFALVIALSLSFSAFAAGTVTYSGDAKKFIFEPGSDYTPSDLFDEFKDVMPGDKITEKITVKNDASEKVTIKIYMRALGAEEGYEDFLSQLNLTVEQVGYTSLFDAPADQKTGLEDWVCLGSLSRGGKVDLNVTLNVPEDLDTKYQDTVGILDWQFKVEEIPVPEEEIAPKTGDNFPLMSMVLLLTVSACAAALVAFRRKAVL